MKRWTAPGTGIKQFPIQSKGCARRLYIQGFLHKCQYQTIQIVKEIINDESIEHISYSPITKQWINRFLARHPDLESIVGKTIDTAWVKNMMEEKLMEWINDMHKVFKENN